MSDVKKAGMAYAESVGAVPGASLVLKKLLKKKNTNVGKAGKARRRERQDTRAADRGGRSEKKQTKVTARRAKVDAKDTKRFAGNFAARTRVNNQITKSNERRGRSDALYAGPAEGSEAFAKQSKQITKHQLKTSFKTKRKAASKADRSFHKSAAKQKGMKDYEYYDKYVK